MDYSSFKSQSRSTAERFKTPISKITLMDNDIQMEKEYLQKLKLQRNKTEKLYSEYIELTKQREKMRQEIEDLRRQLQQWKGKYAHTVQDGKVEVRRLLAESESYQSEIRKMTAERMKQSQYASGQYASKIKDLEEQLGYFRDLQSDKKMRVGELEEKVGKAKRLTQKLTTENDALKLKIKNIENRYEESIKKYQSQKELFEKTKLSFEQERRQLQLAVSDRNEQFETLKSQYESNRGKQKNYNQIYHEFQQSKTYWHYRIQEKSSEIQELQRVIEDYRQKAQTLQDKIYKLEQQREAAEQGQRKARKDYNELLMKCKGQEEELVWVHQRCCQLTEEINGHDLVVQKLKERIADLKDQNNVYIKLFEQKREIESQRRELVENQLQQVDKFERLLQNIL